MKFGLLSATVATSIGVALATASAASAATLYANGTDGEVKSFLTEIAAPTLFGPTTSFQLNLVGLHYDGELPLLLSLARHDLETDETTFSDTFEVTETGDISYSIGEFMSLDRAANYQLFVGSLIDGPTESAAPFSFDYWSIQALTTPGTEFCDEFTGSFRRSDTVWSRANWIHETCYNPTLPLLTNEAGDRFLQTTSSSGVILPVKDEPISTYRNPEESIIVEGSRRIIASGYVVGSSLDIDFAFGNKNCFLGDKEGRVIGISEACRNPAGKLKRVQGTVSLFDDDGNLVRTERIGSVRGVTTGLSDGTSESVPEPSLLVGLLATIGVAVRTKLGRAQ